MPAIPMDIYRIRDWEFEDDVESGVSVGTGEVATLLLTVVALLMTEPELVVATVEVVTSADIVVIAAEVVGAGLTEVTC